jgi:hypothetical protein
MYFWKKEKSKFVFYCGSSRKKTWWVLAVRSMVVRPLADRSRHSSLLYAKWINLNCRLPSRSKIRRTGEPVLHLWTPYGMDHSFETGNFKWEKRVREHMFRLNLTHHGLISITISWHYPFKSSGSFGHPALRIRVNTECSLSLRHDFFLKQKDKHETCIKMQSKLKTNFFIYN